MAEAYTLPTDKPKVRKNLEDTIINDSGIFLVNERPTRERSSIFQGQKRNNNKDDVDDVQQA